MPMERPAGSSLTAQFSCDRSVLRRTLPTAAPTATAGAARPDLRRHELAVGFFPHGKDAVADFEIFQGDGLTLFGEGGLVIDHDDSFALAATHLDLVPVNGKNFAARAIARHSVRHRRGPYRRPLDPSRHLRQGLLDHRLARRHFGTSGTVLP